MHMYKVGGWCLQLEDLMHEWEQLAAWFMNRSIYSLCMKGRTAV